MKLRPRPRPGFGLRFRLIVSGPVSGLNIPEKMLFPLLLTLGVSSPFGFYARNFY